MTTKQAPALHEPSCERAVRDLELIAKLRASRSWPIARDALLVAMATRLTPESGEFLSDLIALLEPDQ